MTRVLYPYNAVFHIYVLNNLCLILKLNFLRVNILAFLLEAAFTSSMRFINSQMSVLPSTMIALPSYEGILQSDQACDYYLSILDVLQLLHFVVFLNRPLTTFESI